MTSVDTARGKFKTSKRSSKSGGQERLKTVVRRLPANLPEEVFWQSVQNWVTDDTTTWKAFYAGKLRKKVNKENILSRAYIAFKSEEMLATFSREYDGHIFRDKAGNESRAVVEFAPYQKIPPSEKKKIDNRNGTIEKDEDFISFMQLLDSSNAKPHDTETLLETLIASTQPQPQPKSTPLLEALKAEKSAQKDKEAILRNHPHYKDVQVASKKEDPKKKDPPTPTPLRPVEPTTPYGKKASKKAAAAQKAAQQQQRGKLLPQNGATTPAPATGPPPPPTAPKAMRAGRQQTRAQPQRMEQHISKHPGTPSSTVESTSSASSIAPSASAAESTTAPSAPVGAPGGRRPRTVLGLAASRQFEAALSGAGVAKVRRERGGINDKEGTEDGGKEKERDPPAKDITTLNSTSSPQVISPSQLQKKPPPARADASVLPVTGILQRNPHQPPRILTRTPEPEGNQAESPATPGPDSVRGKGFGGRGRGRGRGRGAPRGV